MVVVVDGPEVIQIAILDFYVPVVVDDSIVMVEPGEEHNPGVEHINVLVVVDGPIVEEAKKAQGVGGIILKVSFVVDGPGVCDDPLYIVVDGPGVCDRHPDDGLDGPLVSYVSIVFDVKINDYNASIGNIKSSRNGGVIACGRHPIIPVASISPIVTIGTSKGGLRISSSCQKAEHCQRETRNKAFHDLGFRLTSYIKN